MREVSNRALLRVPKDVLLVLLVLSMSVASFGLGMLSQRQLQTPKGGGFWMEDTSSSSPTVLGASVLGAGVGVLAEQTSLRAKERIEKDTTPDGVVTVGKYVASKNGTKYYLPSCKSAKRIKEENRVWFATKEEAQAAGKTPSANCKGL